ncbi:MAG: ABC transporter permease [Maledivibacter sp.]|jgi:simple sugar transport system permease protein|nr:ABC transporter permease [Maledivibacter sp.]
MTVKIDELKDSPKKTFRFKKFLKEQSVTILFLVVCLISSYYSGYAPGSIVREIITRLARNGFLVLSLIIPVIAGMGLNFGIVIGAMAGQIAIFFVTHWGVSGVPGFFLCIAVATPLAIVFGILTGILFNKTKGQEMIAGMIAGFFTMGLYQFLFLVMMGTVIPVENKVLMISGGVGVRNTIDLSRNRGIKYALDGILRLPFLQTIIVCSVLVAVVFAFLLVKSKSDKRFSIVSRKKMKTYIAFSIIIILSTILIYAVDSRRVAGLKLPMSTFIVIGILCIFNALIVKTKLGQDFRTVGQSMHIAKVSGINVDRVRIIAVTISIVLAAWGQIIFLQNIGTLSTYGSHVQIATFSIAAILIGGASASRATSGQAILGVILFHTLFYVSPKAGNNLFGSAQIGEYFRAFVAYGIIGVSLGLHAWKKLTAKK